MLWNAFYRYLSKNSSFEVFWTSSTGKDGSIRFRVDALYISSLESILKERQYDCIINCIWYIRPEKQCRNEQELFLINSHFPKVIELFSQKYWYRIFHFSTDCVFTGERWWYSSQDTPDELGIYGMSKYLWEIIGPWSLTFRTSIIGIESGKNTKNLLNWFLSQPEGDKIPGYTQVFWNGTTTLCMAKIVEKIMMENLLLSGLIQISSETISKYDLLKIFQKVFQKDISIFQEVTPISNKTLIPDLQVQNLFWDILVNLEQQIQQLKDFYTLE